LQYYKLGKSGYNVSRICFGTLTIGPLCANLSLEAGASLIKEAVDLGINFFDTAQQYRTYPYLRKALFGIGEDVIIASKTLATNYDEAAYDIEEARIGLARDKIDIFLLHEQRNIQELHANLPALEALLDAKQNGVIGAVGISTHSSAVAAAVAVMSEIDILFALVNIAGIGINDGSLEDMEAACIAAKKQNIGVYGMKAIGGGALMHQAKSALNWAYSRLYLDSVAVGIKDHAELVTNIAWCEGREATESSKIELYNRQMVFDKDPVCHGCGSCVARCPQGAIKLINGMCQWQKQKCLYCGYCIAACPWFCISFC